MINNYSLQLELNNKYHYYEFNKDKFFYEAVKDLLNEGYVIKRHIFLALELKKDDTYILSPIHLDNPNDFENELNNKNPHHEIVMPDFNDSVLNIISGIRDNFGFNHRYDIDKSIFDKKYDHTVVLLLDGLGVNVLEENLDPNSHLRIHYYKTVKAIFPSTTAAATTSIKSGLTPQESGWTGWHNYFEEIKKDVVLFTGNEFYSDNKTGVSAYKLMPYKPFFNDMGMGRIVEPDFSKKIKLKSILKDSLKTIKNDKVQYVYYTEPDSIMHGCGTYSIEAKNELKRVDKLVFNYAKKLPQNTLLVIVADHGHIPVSQIDFFDNDLINNLLERKPTNDTRCLVFKVKENEHKKFEELFNFFYGDIYKLYKTEDALKLNLFGNANDEKCGRIKDLLGDYVGIATSEFLLTCMEKDFKFKSHHAGLTENEMLVPIIVFKK